MNKHLNTNRTNKIREVLDLDVFDLFHFFEEKITSYYSKRKQTEYYYNLIREQILIVRKPLVAVRPLYKILKEDKGCNFTYQYFNKIIEQNWSVTLIGSKRHIIVASERERLCEW